jgi:gliding motility-associated-like protein
LTSLRVAESPPSGAFATIDSKGILTINYDSIPSFTGADNITIGACDLNDYCATQVFSITVAESSELTVYQGISPNGDGVNDSWEIKNITGTETAVNHVTVFNRWGDSVFEVDNYDNAGNRFDGHNKSGGELPTGIYFYRITFVGGKSSLNGYLSLKWGK